VLSPNSALATAAAAAAAAACANDPNKFQALLIERTKALAAEALKNGASDAISEGESRVRVAVISGVMFLSRVDRYIKIWYKKYNEYIQKMYKLYKKVY